MDTSKVWIVWDTSDGEPGIIAVCTSFDKARMIRDKKTEHMGWYGKFLYIDEYPVDTTAW